MRSSRSFYTPETTQNMKLLPRFENLKFIEIQCITNDFEPRDFGAFLNVRNF